MPGDEALFLVDQRGVDGNAEQAAKAAELPKILLVTCFSGKRMSLCFFETSSSRSSRRLHVHQNDGVECFLSLVDRLFAVLRDIDITGNRSQTPIVTRCRAPLFLNHLIVLPRIEEVFVGLLKCHTSGTGRCEILTHTIPCPLGQI